MLNRFFANFSLFFLKKKLFLKENQRKKENFLQICNIFLIFVIFIWGENSWAAKKKRPKNLCPPLPRPLPPKKAPVEKAFIVIDIEKKQILAAAGLHRSLYPASLAKMMTLFLLFEYLAKGIIKEETLFTASVKACQQPPSKLGLYPGQCLSVQQCIYALSLRSSNDVAYMVAENMGHVICQSGMYSEEFKTLKPLKWIPKIGPNQWKNPKVFVHAMNRTAARWGLRRSFFCTASGWHHPEQRTCIMDMAKLTALLWKNHSIRSQKFFNQKEHFFPGYGILRSTNRLQGKEKGLIFGKTGYTSQAGYNLATLWLRAQRPYVIVVMRATSSKERFEKVSSLARTYLPKDGISCPIIHNRNPRKQNSPFKFPRALRTTMPFAASPVEKKFQIYTPHRFQKNSAKSNFPLYSLKKNEKLSRRTVFKSPPLPMRPEKIKKKSSFVKYRISKRPLKS